MYSTGHENFEHISNNLTFAFILLQTTGKCLKNTGALYGSSLT